MEITAFITDAKETYEKNSGAIWLTIIIFGPLLLWLLIMLIWGLRAFINGVIRKKEPQPKYELSVGAMVALALFVELIAEVLAVWSYVSSDGGVGCSHDDPIWFLLEIYTWIGTRFIGIFLLLIFVMLWGIRRQDGFWAFVKALVLSTKAEALQFFISIWKQPGIRAILKILFMSALTEYFLGFFTMLTLIALTDGFNESSAIRTESFGIFFSLGTICVRMGLYFLFYRAFCQPPNGEFRLLRFKTFVIFFVACACLLAARHSLREKFGVNAICRSYSASTSVEEESAVEMPEPALESESAPELEEETE